MTYKHFIEALLLAGLIMLLGAWLYGKPPKVIAPAEASVQKVVLPPLLKRICTCESGYKHLDSEGRVIKGKVNMFDTGICQINLKYHSAKASELKLDLFNEEDNKAFALYLYKTEGTKPWEASRSCWISTGTKK